MLILGGASTKKIQLITSAAASIRPVVSWIKTDTSTPPVPQDLDTTFLAAITSATTTDILAGATSTRTRVGVMSFRNADASVTCDCTVQMVDGTNTEVLIKATLLPGETLHFTGTSWVHYDSNGGAYGPSNPKLDAKLYVSTDVVNATTSFADITGLTVALQSGKRYAFEARLIHVNNASTTGSQFGVNIGAAPTTLVVGTIDTVTPSVTAAAVSAGAATALDTAITAQTTGSTSNRLAVISGFIRPSADGTFAIRCKSEVAVAAGLTVKAGSWLRIWECD